MNQAVAKFEPFWAFQKQRLENCVCLGVSDGCTTHSRASGIQVSFKLTGVRVQIGKIGVRQVGGGQFWFTLKMPEFFLFIAFF